MAVHSVPQDVEADDKLFLFLSLKQFIFVIIGFGFGYLAFFFFTKVHPLTALIWIPFSLIFLVLGLYQRKDQPAEVFLASAVGFYLKPHVRIWSQDGYEERVHITAPPVIEKKYTKDFTGDEAKGRLANLSLMMDSRGWASKQINDWQNPTMASVAAGSDRILDVHDVAASQAIDPMKYSQPADPYDDRSMVGKQFETKIEIADATTHQAALKVMEQAHNEPSQLDTAGIAAAPAAQIPPSTSTIDPATVPTDNTTQPTPTSQINIPSITDFDDVISDTPTIATTTKTKEPADEPTPKKKDEPKEKSQELNVAHENEDGSVELRLH